MKPFTCHFPVEIRFGNNITENLGSYLAGRYRSALLVAAKGPFRENGLHGLVKRSLEDAGLRTFESPDIDSNPRISTVREAVSICTERGADIVVALGGGSAMDAGKVTAAAAAMKVDPYDLIWGKRLPVTVSLPLVTVPTIAATGTEVNEYAVIVDDETREKYWCVTKHPVLALLDPVNSRSVPRDLTIWGAMDILSHVFEFYFNDDRNSDIQNRISEAILLAAMSAVETLSVDPENLHARGELMWCAVMAWGGITKIGRGEPDMTCHSIEESFSGYFDTHHGACLGVLTPVWMERTAPRAPGPFADFARNVMGIREEDDRKAAQAGVIRYREWLKKVGAPSCFSDFGGGKSFDDTGLEIVAENAMKIYGGSIGRLCPIRDKRDLLAILYAGRGHGQEVKQ